MLTSSAKIALAASVLTMAAFVTAAKASDAKIKHMSFSIAVPPKSEITVTSSDGSRWDTILPAKFPLWASIVVDTRFPGYVERAGIFLGTCTDTGCAANPRLAFWANKRRDWTAHGNFDF